MNGQKEPKRQTQKTFELISCVIKNYFIYLFSEHLFIFGIIIKKKS